MNARRLLVASGLAVFAIAVAELFAPGSFPLPASETLLTLFGGLFVLYAFAAYRSRRRSGPEFAETPDVELRETTRVPGTELDETLEGFPGADQVYAGIFSSIKNGLREVAVAVLTRIDGDDEERARERVASGNWTDDPYASAFLSDGRQSVQSVRDRLRRLFARDAFQRRNVERSADAIARKADVEPGEREEAETPNESDRENGTKSRVPNRGIDGLEVLGREPTNHWTGVSVVALLCLGIGLFLETPAVLLAGVGGISYAAYARSSAQGHVDLSVSRAVSETDPDPGEEIEVTLTVTNEGSLCPDLRVVDGVPERLSVEEGSARLGTALRSGESATVSYTLTARQGRHEFGPVLALARTLPGSAEEEVLIGTDTTIETLPSPQPAAASVPLRKQHTRYAGQTTTDTGGEGIEFQKIRKYQPGDSMARIDWNRRARTGELTTLEFRRERAAKVAILVDVRPSAFVGPTPDEETAVERAIDGAHRLFLRLLDDGHQVGLAAVGPRECYLPPGSGADHRQRGRELLATDPAFHARPEEGTTRTRWGRSLRKKLPDNTQLLVFSPLLDPRTVRIMRQFEAHGYPTTVVSPDPTADDTPSRRLMRVRRQFMLTDTRQAGVPVLDWQPSEPIEKALKREVATR